MPLLRGEPGQPRLAHYVTGLPTQLVATCNVSYACHMLLWMQQLLQAGSLMGLQVSHAQADDQENQVVAMNVRMCGVIAVLLAHHCYLIASPQSISASASTTRQGVASLAATCLCTGACRHGRQEAGMGSL